MNIAVCDDQPEVLDVVENMLREIPEVERVETYQDIRHMRDEFEDRRILRLFLSRCICHSHIRRPHIGAVRTLNSPGKSGKGRDLECCREDAGEDSCFDRFFHSDPPHLNLALISL